MFCKNRDMAYTVTVYDKYAKPKGFRTPLGDMNDRTYLRNLTKEIMSHSILPLRNEACKDSVSPGYIAEAIHQNSLIMVFKRDNKPHGFIISSPKRGSGVYLDVICAKSEGSKFLQYFIDYVESRGYGIITLSALPTVLTFYPRFGFEHRKSCAAGADVVPLPAAIQAKIAAKKLPKDMEEVYFDDDFRAFMLELHNKGFSTKRDELCALRDLNEYELGWYECFDDGYKMRRCGTRRRTSTRRAAAKTRKSAARRAEA